LSDRPDGGRDNPGGADLKRAPARAPGARAVRPKHAASLILWRQPAKGPAEILMGMRHAKHKFMPSVLVFPGGRVDRADYRAPVQSPLRAEPAARLAYRATSGLARALGVAAARELQEETGLLLGEMRAGRLAADLDALDHLCRAITPPSRAMRFDARFLVAKAERATGSLGGSGELEALGWVSLAAARAASLANITAQILGEFEAWLALTEAARAARPHIIYRGNDNRTEER
jgi:8-oxo-dGTP pyrophosphatase MutT (NUDIX family)